MYFVQFSMSQKRRKGAKFMPENEVFGQAGGGVTDFSFPSLYEVLAHQERCAA